jgi:hypothetical protein
MKRGLDGGHVRHTTPPSNHHPQHLSASSPNAHALSVRRLLAWPAGVCSWSRTRPYLSVASAENSSWTGPQSARPRPLQIGQPLCSSPYSSLGRAGRRWCRQPRNPQHGLVPNTRIEGFQTAVRVGSARNQLLHRVTLVRIFLHVYGEGGLGKCVYREENGIVVIWSLLPVAIIARPNPSSVLVMQT